MPHNEESDESLPLRSNHCRSLINHCQRKRKQAYSLSLLSIPLLGQRVVGRQWLAIGVSYIGVFVIATRRNLLTLYFDNPRGVGLALFSTVLWAFYWILNTRDKRDPIIGLFLNFVCAFPFILLYVFFTEGFRSVGLDGVLGATYIGFFEMGILPSFSGLKR